MSDPKTSTTNLAGVVLFIVLAVSVVMSVITFIVYGLDKLGAKINDPKKRHTRVPEKLLIALAFACGAPGAALGMIVFHHKIRKTKFITLVPLSLILWIAVLMILRFLYYYI